MFISSVIASTFLLLTPTVARPASIWDVHIFRGPAPPPDEGPPVSADALRDRSKLKYEIVGIAGAYLVWTFITILLIVFLGRKLRYRKRTSYRTISREMIKPAPLMKGSKMDVAPGPLSPGKMASLRSWASGSRSHSHSHKPSNVSVSTVDEKTLESDRARNMDEMAKLYAAVMAHDEKRSQMASSSVRTLSPRSPQFPPSPATFNNSTRMGPSPPISPRYPPEFQHLRDPLPQAPPQSQSQAVDQIYPLAPTPASDTFRSTDTSRSSTRQMRASPLSFISTSHGRAGSGNSAKIRPSNISVHGQSISQPMGSADLRNSAVDSAEIPLSPRLYNPGPPPPTPGKQKSADSQTREMGWQPMVTLGDVQQRGGTMTNNSSTSALPFRQMYSESLRSAPPTKTTFLDRRESRFPPHPKTGMPQTPYSPYTPFTPMTPITPRRLMSKNDMKKKRKEEGLKVVSDDDMVRSDEDMWGKVN